MPNNFLYFSFKKNFVKNCPQNWQNFVWKENVIFIKEKVVFQIFYG